MTDKRVYFLRPVGQLGPVKIGCSKLPELRLDSFTIWSPVRLELVTSVPGTHSDERALHGAFAKHHLHGEWFGASKELLALIDYCRENGVLPPLPRVVKFPRTAHVGFKGRKSKAPRQEKPQASREPRIFEGDRERGAALLPKYEAGASLQELADAEGVALQTVRRLLIIAGAEIRKRGAPEIKRGVADMERAQIMRDRYVAGETLKQIGDDYGVSRERVRQILRKIAVPSLGLRHEHKHRAHELTANEVEAARLYEAGTPPRELSERFDLTTAQLLAAVRRCGYEVKSVGKWNLRDDDAEITATTAELYQQGLSAKQIVERVPQLKFPETVYRYLRKAGVRPRRPVKRGAADACASAIIGCYQRGKTIKEVAETFGFSTATIDKLLRRHGVKRSRKESEAVRVNAVRRASALRHVSASASPLNPSTESVGVGK